MDRGVHGARSPGCSIRMSYSMACDDVVAGCDATFAADTKHGLLGKIIDHAASAHGIVEVTPEVAAAIGAAIRQS